LCPKCAKTRLRASVTLKFFSGGYTPGPPLKWRGYWKEGKGREGRDGKRRDGKREGREGRDDTERKGGGRKGGRVGMGERRERQGRGGKSLSCTTFRTVPAPMVAFLIGKNGGKTIAAAMGRVRLQVTSPFNSFTLIWYTWALEFCVYMSLIKSYLTSLIWMQNAL
jgi:hypothetical protein